MTSREDVDIIFDNGGGATLQTTIIDGCRYAHQYNDMMQLAEDIQALVAGNDPVDWDGNEYDDETGLMDIDYDDERNGGYRSYRLDNLLAIVANVDDDDYEDDYCMPGNGWGNIIETIKRLREVSR